MGNPSIPNISDHLLDILDEFCGDRDNAKEFKRYAMEFLWDISDECDGAKSPYRVGGAYLASRQVFIPMIHLLYKLWKIEKDA